MGDYFPADPAQLSGFCELGLDGQETHFGALALWVFRMGQSQGLQVSVSCVNGGTGVLWQTTRLVTSAVNSNTWASKPLGPNPHLRQSLIYRLSLNAHDFYHPLEQRWDKKAKVAGFP